MTQLSKVIRDWLAEYKALTDVEVHTYASTICQSDELTVSLYKLFESSPSIEILDPVCHQLFEFYRSKESELRRFSLEFIPTLSWLYLTLLSLNGKKSCGGVEAVLLAIYNLEIVTSDGKAKVKTLRIPSFGQPSVFHEPNSISTLTLTESALSRYDETESETWTSGPYPQHEAINGQNRQGILAYLLQCYNAEVASLSDRSHLMLCKAYSGIVNTGFSSLYYSEDDDKGSECSSNQGSIGNRDSHCGELIPRIAVSPTLLIEMLSGLYYVMFNGQMALGVQAIMDIHYRAGYELYADVQLVTNAIKNSLRGNVSGQAEDGPMGISVSVSPSATSYALSKSAITNASFRTKKLPDDITIPADADAAGKQLATIEEDVDVQNKPAGKQTKPGKGNKKLEKSRSKELRKDPDTVSKSSITNGDVTDGVQVAVVRSSSKTLVDSIEMQPLSKHVTNSDEMNSSNVEDGNVVSHANKHRNPSLSTSSSNKDLKSKHGHTRFPSEDSVNSNSYSTDL